MLFDLISDVGFVSNDCSSANNTIIAADCDRDKASSSSSSDVCWVADGINAVVVFISNYSIRFGVIWFHNVHWHDILLTKYFIQCQK